MKNIIFEKSYSEVDYCVEINGEEYLLQETHTCFNDYYELKVFDDGTDITDTPLGQEIIEAFEKEER